MKSKLLIGLATAGLVLAGFGGAVVPASADPHHFVLTLADGSQVQWTGEAGTAPPSIDVEGVPTAVVDTQDLGAVVDAQDLGAVTATAAPPTPEPPPAPAPAPPAPASAAPPPPPPTEEPVAGRQERQRTIGAKDRSSRAGDEDETTRARTDADRAPTDADPGFSLALPGPAPIGVPNFFIDKFRIPPFLLPIYQAAGIEYGVRWEILAAINEIETDYGRNLNVSSAGALGWMQFMPATWRMYGVDANRDGRKDPYNPVDAIFAAARYLKAAGADQDISRAVFAYNHANWYVDSVLMRARLIGGLPADLIGSLTGLTQGHFPVHAQTRYAEDLSALDTHRRVKRGRNAALAIESQSTRRAIRVYARPGSPVVAVQDGKIVRMGRSALRGRFVQLRDVYGNTYTYGHLKKLATAHPVPKERGVEAGRGARAVDPPKRDPRPTIAASAGRRDASTSPAATPAVKAEPEVEKQRLYANPYRPDAYRAGGEEQLWDSGAELPGDATFRSYFTQVYGLKRKDVVLRELRVGSRVIAGTILGRIGRTDERRAAHMRFEIRPAGRGAPRIDPKPILDGWKLLESTAIYRAAGRNPFFGPDAKNPSIGQILLMSKEALQRRVLTNPRINAYGCGRRDIRAGIVDRRVLATIEFLAASGLKPTVTSLRCGHGYLTASGNVSHHSSGNAVDIAAVNGIPILGHQGPGSIADITIRRLLTLQGTMKPEQVISLMTYEGADNTLSMSDHADHIHVGFQPLFGTNPRLGWQLNAILKPNQWQRLIDRIGRIENPTVRVRPSKDALKVGKRRRAASRAHVGE